LESFRFIHTGDIHLDSPLKGLSGQQGAAAERIRIATRVAFDNLVSQAIEEQVAFVIVAGDLYDGDWRDYQTGLFFVRQMGRLAQAGIPDSRPIHRPERCWSRDLRSRRVSPDYPHHPSNVPCPLLWLGLAVAALRLVEPCQVVEADQRVRMTRPERLAPRLQHFFQERLGLAVAALVSVEQREVAEARQRVRMVRPEYLAVRLQRLLQEWLGLAGAGLVLVQRGQIFEKGAGILGYCLNVLGLSLVERHKGFGREHYPRGTPFRLFLCHWTGFRFGVPVINPWPAAPKRGTRDSTAAQPDAAPFARGSQSG
jgi:Calcineurin-like phosphoesterase